MKKLLFATIFIFMLFLSPSPTIAGGQCDVGSLLGSCSLPSDCLPPNSQHNSSACASPNICCIAPNTNIKPGNLGGTIQGLGGYDPGTSIEEATGSISSLMSNIMGLLTIIAGISFLIYFTIGGLTWLTAGGDKGKVEAAQNRMTGGAIGMIIVVSAWAIAWIIGQVLGIDFLNPIETIIDLKPGGGL